MQMFLAAYSQVFHSCSCETANHILAGNNLNKSSCNTHLQTTYGISKRYGNGVISDAQGAVDASKKHRKLHIEKLKGKLEFIINKKRFSVRLEYCQPVHGSDGYSYAEISARASYLLEL
ncbi:hypothetical protein [Microseira wollei]|uniref:Uncharacterized protein n=1 Tax=Microseira wollei NIES-4236 TaxID=2530354 RepID=A0AAV3XF17_9CYAN|nr:hypothetical protein [Microseira wollei]GET38710.1 hypothetical protein MiSe_34690 [Microseira wollei NIES-4236]